MENLTEILPKCSTKVEDVTNNIFGTLNNENSEPKDIKIDFNHSTRISEVNNQNIFIN